MKRRPIYYETMSVQWISESLSRFFKDIGYNFLSNTVQEVNEALVPLDRIYAAKKGKRLLLFGLQFKTPYRRKNVICWKVDPSQHQTLTNEYFSKFIWYCLPFMKNISSWKNILYHSLFVNPRVCENNLKWFIWDDYFLYFYPGGGGCNRFLEELRHLPCGRIPIRILDSKLRIASKNRWNYSINYDSWGTLFYKLLNAEVGFSVKTDADYDDLRKHISGEHVRPLKDEAIIIAVDVVNQTVDAISIVGFQEIEDLKDSEDLFPLSLEEGDE